MPKFEAVSPSWTDWQDGVSVDAGNKGELDELPGIFTHVRLQGMTSTQETWAKDPRTRTFCDLALHLLYEHYIRRQAPGAEGCGLRVFANIRPQDLADHAQQSGFFTEHDADSLNVHRFSDTWGNQRAFCEDLIAYVFRTAPYIRRFERMRPQYYALTRELPLGEWMRRTAQLEVESLLSHPLISLHTLVEAMLPQDRRVGDASRKLHSNRLHRWALLYEQVFTAYGAPLRDPARHSWLTVAEQIATIAVGAFVRAQTQPSDTAPGLASELIGQIAGGMMPSLLDIEAGDIETRQLQHPVKG